jgi:hypothetical protein
VQGPQRVRIQPAKTSGEVCRLGTGSEYLLIENRGPGAFDRRLSSCGLAVDHVARTVKLKGDEGAFVERGLDCVPCVPFHPYTRLVQADGLYEIDRGGKFDAHIGLVRDGRFLRPGLPGNALSKDLLFFDGNRSAGEGSGWLVDDIRVQEEGSIEVTPDAPAEGQCAEALCAGREGCAPVTCGESSTVRSSCAAAPGSALAVLALLLLEERLRRRQQLGLRRA